MGADTDALRDAGQECQEGKEKTDQVIAYLRMLIMALRAASFFTGGASAAYAEYLETTVVPWLQRISQALGLMAQVLMSNADDQDGVSDSGSQITGGGTALSYSTPGGSMPSTPIGVWEGSLVPAATPPGATSDTGSSFSSLGSLPAAGGTPGAVITVDAGSPTATATPLREGGAPTIGTGSALGTPGSTGSWATSDHVGSATQGALGQTGSWDGGAATIGGGSLDHGATGATGSGAGASGGASGGASSGGGSGSSPLGSSSIGSPLGSTGSTGDDTSGAGLSSYANGNLAGLGGGTPDSGTGSSSLGAPSSTGTTESGSGSYGAVAGVAGGAAALGLGGAALAGRNGSATDKRIDELGTQNGRGSRGTGVSELQQKLTEAGYDTKGSDGVWGRNTQAAYDAYRKDHPLPIQHGSGYTSPSGFDYSSITGVRGNANVTPQFLREVEGVAQRIGARPEHLMAVMSFETGGQFGADTPTKAKGGTAVGLIQFTPVARDQVGATRDQLMAMTPTQQLAYVEKYFEPRRGPQLGSIAGLYSAVLGGTASNDLDRVQIAGPGRAYDMNSGLDTNNDNKITVREGAARIERALQGR
ncbi:peptidoglycan-binding domain-containing protein [Nocardioides currus]|nr:peptidoglycan-binding domain-containing protein [Nocardioides currus]